MIIKQSPVEVAEHGSSISSEIVLEIPCVDEEDDIHICGTCKRQFNDIFVFMRHKSEGSCTSAFGKNIVSVTVPPDASTQIFSPMVSTGVKLQSVPLPETLYTRVAILGNDAIHLQKYSPPKGETPPDLPENVHLSESSLSAESSSLLLSEVNSESLNLRKIQESCKSSSHAAQRQLFQQHGIEMSEHLIEDHNMSDHEETEESMVSSHNCSEAIPQANIDMSQRKVAELQNEESQNPEHSMIRRCGFLDIEDVEVATLLANHLANEPTLHMYPSASESLLSYTNMPSQLGLADPSYGLNFVSDVDIEEKCPESPSRKRPQIDLTFAKKARGNQKSFTSPTKATQANISTTAKLCSGTGNRRKVHSCQEEGCGFTGPSVRDLNRHIRTHTGEKPFKCPQCEKKFSRRDKLTFHLRIHSGTKSFKCELCGYASVDHYGIVRHMRVHNNERPYKCQICDYGARTMSHLKVHLRTHTGDHPYVCKLKCGKAFKTSSDLHRHMRVHSGDKPFSCPHCSYCCSLKTNLQTHIRLMHSLNQTFPCSKCDTVYHSRRDLKKHEMTHGGNLQRCSHCDYACVTKTALLNHLKTHSIEKKRCSPFLGSKRALGGRKPQTRRRQSSKKVKASSGTEEETSGYCSKTFNCEYCNASFWREDALKIHTRQHELEERVPSPSPTLQDPVLADSADSRDSTDSNSMDSSIGLASLATLASYHSIADQTSSEHQPAFMYRYMSGLQSNDNIRTSEILTSLNHSSGGLPQYVAIQGDQSALVDALNSMQYVLPSPLGSLDDSDNATPLLC